ncbi:hypothetical protein Ddc_15852 [Ditylenchus destructor]|nr:hypothetical protein Ddc_15852 [Ditylenchus destructor]
MSDVSPSRLGSRQVPAEHLEIIQNLLLSFREERGQLILLQKALEGIPCGSASPQDELVAVNRKLLHTTEMIIVLEEVRLNNALLENVPSEIQNLDSTNWKEKYTIECRKRKHLETITEKERKKWRKKYAATLSDAEKTLLQVEIFKEQNDAQITCSSYMGADVGTQTIAPSQGSFTGLRLPIKEPQFGQNHNLD